VAIFSTTISKKVKLNAPTKNANRVVFGPSEKI